jgi:hypothetical protein
MSLKQKILSVVTTHPRLVTFSIRSFVPVVLATLLSALIVLQSFAVILGPMMPNAAAATVPNFNIAAVGDWGCKTDTTSTVNKIVGKSPELSISLADNSYGTTADCWFSKVSPIDSQLHTAIGNHDVMSTTLLAQYMNHYKMQQQYYSFKYQNIHFLVLSTETDYAVGTPQYNFAKADLQNAASDPSVQWIIVSFHRLMYGSPNDHNVTSATSLRKIYHPLFQQYGVDLVLDGHMHSYERSYPLKFNSANPGSPIIESTSTSTYNDPVGQIFATVGTGGFSHHTFTSKSAAFATQANGVFGFLNIDMLNNGQTLTATFYSNGGTTKDKFTIQKSQSSSSPTSTVSTNINTPADIPPQANAGLDRAVNEGAMVTLEASKSSDADGKIEYYQWTQTAGPLVQLMEPDDMGGSMSSIKTTFRAPDVGPNGATLQFRLTVFDAEAGKTGRDTVAIKVNGT